MYQFSTDDCQCQRRKKHLIPSSRKSPTRHRAKLTFFLLFSLTIARLALEMLVRTRVLMPKKPRERAKKEEKSRRYTLNSTILIPPTLYNSPRVREKSSDTNTRADGPCFCCYWPNIGWLKINKSSLITPTKLDCAQQRHRSPSTAMRRSEFSTENFHNENET